MMGVGRRRGLVVGGLLLVTLAIGAAALPWAPRRSGVGRVPVPPHFAVVGNDGQVQVAATIGATPVTVSRIGGVISGEAANARELASARWPAWSPNGQRLAFVRIVLDDADDLGLAQVWAVAADGSDPRKLWEGSDRYPIYLSWSPDGRLVGLLIQHEQSISLVVVDSTGDASPRTVIDGGPLYFSWAPDSRRILAHVGDRKSRSTHDLLIVQLGPPDAVRSFGVAPGDFRAPLWSADGQRIAYVAEAADGSGEISTVHPSGGDIAVVATVKTAAALALSGDGRRLAWSSRSTTDPLALDGLDVAASDARDRVRVTDQPILAFFWSPDDRHLAYLALDRAERAYVWNVVDASGRASRRLGIARPTDGQFQLFGFFDQYALTHGVWSVDGQTLIYAEGTPDDRTDFGGPSRGWIMALPVDGSGRARVVADGILSAVPVPPAAP